MRTPEAGNFSWLLFEYTLRLVLILGATALVARHLGPDGFASFGLLATLISLVLPLSDAGLTNVISRAVIVEERSIEVIFGTAAAIRLLACTVAIPVLVGLAWVSGNRYAGLVLFAAIAGVLNAATSLSVIDYFFQAHLQARIPALVRVAVLAVLAAAQLVLVLADCGLYWFLTTLVVQQPLFGIGYYLVHLRRGGIRATQWRVERQYLRILVGRSAKMASSNLLEALSLRLPVIVLAKVGTVAQTGLLAAAVRPVDIFRVLPNAASASILPRMVRTYRHDRPDFDRFVRSTGRWFVLGGAVLSAALMATGPTVASVLFGSKFDGVGRIIQFYAPVMVFVAARAVMSKWTVTVEEYGFNLLVFVVGAVVSLVASLLLINENPTATTTATVLLVQGVTTTFVAPLLHPAGRRYLACLFKLRNPPPGKSDETESG